MSITLLRHEKAEIIDLLEKILEKLTFAKLDRQQIEQTRMHLDAMRLEAKPMDVLCQLSADEAGNTTLVVRCSFMKGLTQ